MSKEVYPTQATAGAADLSGFVSEMSWRINAARGVKELVRKSDGRVLDTQPLTRRESDQAAALQRPAVPPAVKQENDMDAETKTTDAKPEKHGSLTIIGRGSKPGYSRVECDCGNVTEKLTWAVRNGGVGSCGRACALKVKAKGDAKANGNGHKPVRAAKIKPKAEPAPAAIAEVKSAPVAQINFAAIGDAVDAVTKLARLIPLEQAELMREEIERLESTLPAGDWCRLSEMRAALAEGKRTAAAFVDFRRAIDAPV